MKEPTTDVGKASRKPRRLQWGPRPNTFTCGRCKQSFWLRRKLRVHNQKCTAAAGKERKWQRECKLRIGLLGSRRKLVFPDGMSNQER